LRAVRLEDELGSRLDGATEPLVREHASLAALPAGERVLGELLRLAVGGYRRLAELGLLAALGGSDERAERAALVDSPEFRLVAFLGRAALALPISNEFRRYAKTLLRAEPPADDSPRALHRFRRRARPWELDALAFLGATCFADAVRAAQGREPAHPLVRGDELGLPPGPARGRWPA